MFGGIHLSAANCINNVINICIGLRQSAICKSSFRLIKQLHKIADIRRFVHLLNCLLTA